MVVDGEQFYQDKASLANLWINFETENLLVE